MKLVRRAEMPCELQQSVRQLSRHCELTLRRLTLQSRADIGLSPQGSNYAWALFGIFTLAALLLAFVAHSRPKGRRAFHYLGMAILITTSITYASLAADLSYTPVSVEFVRSGTRGADQLAAGAPFPPTRSIFYGRVSRRGA